MVRSVAQRHRTMRSGWRTPLRQLRNALRIASDEHLFLRAKPALHLPFGGDSVDNSLEKFRIYKLYRPPHCGVPEIKCSLGARRHGSKVRRAWCPCNTHRLCIEECTTMRPLPRLVLRDGRQSRPPPDDRPPQEMRLPDVEHAHIKHRQQRRRVERPQPRIAFEDQRAHGDEQTAEHRLSGGVCQGQRRARQFRRLVLARLVAPRLPLC